MQITDSAFPAIWIIFFVYHGRALWEVFEKLHRISFVLLQVVPQ